jgi:hypothetical protein
MNTPKVIALHGLVFAACLALQGCGSSNDDIAPVVSVPAAPSGLDATAGNATVTLQWTGSSGSTSYKVKRSTTSGGPYSPVASPASTSYTDTGLTNGTAYHYVVSALNSAGESGNSSQASATPVAAISIPAAPTNLSATAGDAQVALTWSASTGATSYRVKRALTSGGTYVAVATRGTTSYADGQVANGTTYYYKISALNSAGESGDSALASATPAAQTGSIANCGLSTPAFCDTFDEGPASTRGRAGDLDSTKWSVAHLVPLTITGDGGNVANHVVAAPIPACRASFTSTSVYPPNDTLICDPRGTRGSQLLTATAVQYYGNNSYMIRQPFDFAGRTGKIDFDVDNGGGYQLLGGYPSITVTQDPAPATTFQEFTNFETGPVPRNGIIVKFSVAAGSCSTTQASAVNVMVYKDYAPTILPSSGTVGCVNISPGAMNHYEIQLSQNSIDIYGTDYSTDDGQTFANLHKIYSAPISLSFTRGYVHVGARNHATVKYGFGPDVVLHWDNIGFDGPVIPYGVSYEIPDNTTMGTYTGLGYEAGKTPSTVMNLGYQLQDGTGGKAAGIYDPVNKLSALQFRNVSTSGMTSARLTFNGFFLNSAQTPATTAWGWQYRFNGGAWRTRTLNALEVSAINNTLAIDNSGSAGNISMVVDVPVGDLANGTNNFEILPIGGAPMNYPPVIANIDLTLLP